MKDSFGAGSGSKKRRLRKDGAMGVALALAVTRATDVLRLCWPGGILGILESRPMMPLIIRPILLIIVAGVDGRGGRRLKDSEGVASMQTQTYPPERHTFQVRTTASVTTRSRVGFLNKVIWRLVQGSQYRVVSSTAMSVTTPCLLSSFPSTKNHDTEKYECRWKLHRQTDTRSK